MIMLCLLCWILRKLSTRGWLDTLKLPVAEDCRAGNAFASTYPSPAKAAKQAAGVAAALPSLWYDGLDSSTDAIEVF